MKRDLNQLAAETYDVIVVGGGIYGACAAREAALQGLSVCLVERDDFGGRTSANSLKIMHGGLRYLQNVDLKRMRESIGERRTLGFLAPHLVRPMAFVIPCYGHLLRGREVMAVALTLNDVISFDRNRGLLPHRRLPRGKVLSRKTVEDWMPDLPESGLLGGAIWYDGQATNTERLLLAFVQGAVAAGARVANHAEVVEFLEAGNTVEGVRVRDRDTDTVHEVRGRIVLNAAGPWVDQLLGRLRGARPAQHFHMSKGMNLVTRQIFPDFGAAIPYQESYVDKQAVLDKGKLHFFIVPWKQYSLIGTRHLPWDGEPDQFRVEEADVHQFLDEINRAYPPAALSREDVVRVYEGMLPALAATGDEAKDVQIGKQYTITDHAISDGLEGLVSLLGVKWTTARDVAEKAIRTVLGKLGRPAVADSATIRLPGGAIADWDQLVEDVRAAAPDLDVGLAERLAESYGSEAPALARAAAAETDGLGLIDGGCGSPTLRHEIRYVVEHEMARHLDDVVLRRTELALGGCPAQDVLETVAEIAGERLGWTPTRRTDEVERAIQAIRRDEQQVDQPAPADLASTAGSAP